MKSPTHSKSHTIRNPIVFVVGVVVLPWLGWGFDVGRGSDPHNQQNSLGWLFFILSPLMVSLLLRAVDGAGWNDTGLKSAIFGAQFTTRSSLVPVCELRCVSLVFVDKSSSGARILTAV